MNDTRKPVKFEWGKFLGRWHSRVGSLTADGGEVSLHVSSRLGKDLVTRWHFQASLWLMQTDPDTTTVSPPWAEGWCETFEEARNKAEMFGRQMLEVLRILARPAGLPVAPKIGDEIYIPSSYSPDYDSSDHCGGKAMITEATLGRMQGEYHWSITTKEVPGVVYNYTFLLEQQEKLAACFGDKRAYLDSDYNIYGGR